MSTASSAGSHDEVISYHGHPVLKQPVWSWEVPFYFYAGGLAGASGGLAYLAELRGNEELGRNAWTAAAGAIMVSPAFLISDLGKPVRFINMLRMFKITSPMSVGSWILSGSGAATVVAAANAWTGLFPRLAGVARPAAALFGLPLCTYTAALLANTAVPAWHEARRELPLVFGSGAALSAGAAALAATPPRHAAPARRLALTGALLEIATKALMERRLGFHGEPYRQGAARTFGRLGQVLIGAGAILAAGPARGARPAAVAAGALLSAGALSARWSVFRAGFQSAADPKYVIGPQRQAIRDGERPGAARHSSRVSEPDPAIGSPATFV